MVNSTSTDNAIKNFTPREIVSELDRYIIGQKDAKRAVAIAMRNRWRRLKVEGELREEIAPKNIIMIGPTGVGKTEIARRLAKISNAPFIKVEASKFTEVGYVGKDVESMIRELTEISVNLVRAEEKENVRVKAGQMAEERLLDLLLPLPSKKPDKMAASLDQIMSGLKGEETHGLGEPPEGKDAAPEAHQEAALKTREKLREQLRAGRLASRMVEIDSQPREPQGIPMVEVISTGGSLEDMSRNIRDMFSQMFPRGRRRKKIKIPEALATLTEEEAAKLIETEDVHKKAIERVEQTGMVFIDEIDKIASRERGGHGPEVSREGVQRDILPIVEGSTVGTKYGMVRTDHILFIAAGAFHVSKPSDLIPELQGRFPIRVEMSSLSEEDFLKILTEPQNSLTRQYRALMKAERVELTFTDDALKEIARFAAQANERMENIGARRLHTVLEKVLDEIAFTASERHGEPYVVDQDYVRQCLEAIINDEDLSHYIL